MSRKLTREYVSNKFQQKGWKLLGDYINNFTPLKCVCKNGHETSITWINFKKGQGCGICSNNQKYDYEYVKNYFESQRCSLISDAYKNSQQNLEYICKCGEHSSIRFAHFKQGVKCQKCRAKSNSERIRHKEEEIKIFCEQHGCNLLSFEIHNHKTRIKYRCKCGNISEAYFCNFKRYPNCKKCGSQKIAGDKCHRWNPDREAVATAKKYRKTCGRILRRALEATEQKKTDHTYTLLGYTSKDLQDHIRNHPNYKGDNNMHIDHIFPIKAFLDHGIKDLKIINALNNLQPLPSDENLEKAYNYDEDEFLEWVNLKT